MSVYTEIATRQRAIEALGADAVTAYRRALLELMPGIEAQVLSAVTRAQAMGATDGAVYAAIRAQAIRRQMEAEIGRLTLALGGQLGAAQTTAILGGLEAAEAGVRALGVDVGVWNRVSFSAVEHLVAATQGESLHALFAKIGPAAGESIARHMVRGIVVGENPRVVARHIRNDLGLSAERANVISRSEMLRAFRLSSLESYRQNGIEEYERLASKSARTCAPCLALDGQRQKTSNLLAVHPADRCSVIPRLSERFGIRQPERETGSEWFDHQDESVQRTILGPGGLDRYQKGTPLSAFARVEIDPTWGPTLRQTPLRDLAA